MDNIEKDEALLKENVLYISRSLERVQSPAHGFDKRRYFALWVNKGNNIVTQGKSPIIFHKDVLYYCEQLAKEMQATIQRFDKAYERASSGNLHFIEVYIIRKRKKRKLGKIELRRRAYEKLKAKLEEEAKQKSDPNRVQLQRITLGEGTREIPTNDKPEVNITDDLDMPPMQGTEHPPDGEQQSTKVYELPSNNTTN